MLRLVQIGSAQAASYPADPVGYFYPGMIGQLKLHGNTIVCGVSDGTAPLGIIDDTRTNAFYAPSIDEIIIEPAVGQLVNGRMVSVTEVKAELRNSTIIDSSFICDTQVVLKPKNGVVVFPVGTTLNFDADGDGVSDSIRAVCSYTYQVPNTPGDNTTMGSGRITIWFHRVMAQTDQFEVNQRYPLNAPLFVSEAGKLTTRRPSDYHPTVAIVLAPPQSATPYLDFMWL